MTSDFQTKMLKISILKHFIIRPLIANAQKSRYKHVTQQVAEYVSKACKKSTIKSFVIDWIKFWCSSNCNHELVKSWSNFEANRQPKLQILEWDFATLWLPLLQHQKLVQPNTNFLTVTFSLYTKCGTVRRILVLF